VKMTELDLCVFKRTAVEWHIACIGKLKDAGGILIRKRDVLSAEVILKWVINGRYVRMLTS
jgi:hypothetical protein